MVSVGGEGDGGISGSDGARQLLVLFMPRPPPAIENERMTLLLCDTYGGKTSEGTICFCMGSTLCYIMW